MEPQTLPPSFNPREFVDHALTLTQPDGIYVNFKYVLNGKSKGYHNRMRETFAQFGYAEAERLPYQLKEDGLYVVWQPAALEAGWFEAIIFDDVPW